MWNKIELVTRLGFGQVCHRALRQLRKELVESLHAPLQLQHQQVPFRLHQMWRPWPGRPRSQMESVCTASSPESQQHRHTRSNAGMVIIGSFTSRKAEWSSGYSLFLAKRASSKVIVVPSITGFFGHSIKSSRWKNSNSKNSKLKSFLPKAQNSGNFF